MASFSTRVKVLSKFRPKIPEKWKGGRLEKIGGFFVNMYRDYRMAVVDMVVDMKGAPRKSGVYLSLLAGGAVLCKTCPSETSFHVELGHSHHQLLMLGDPIRNRVSDGHVRTLQAEVTEGRLRYTNCGFFSLVWQARFDPAVDTFDARCGLVAPRWLDFHRQVLDVGVLGRWVSLRQAMTDFDVNVDEWDKEGNRIKPSDRAGAVQTVM